MARKLAAAGRPGEKAAGRKGPGSLACLLFVIVLALAFWAGAVWIGEFMIRVGSLR